MVTTEHTSEWFNAPAGTLLFGIALVQARARRAGMRLHRRRPARRAARSGSTSSRTRPTSIASSRASTSPAPCIASPAMQPFVGPEQFPGPDVTGDAPAGLIRDHRRRTRHASGTCRMGPDAATSVVDQTGRVHGLDGLWVIDASIIPALPSVPTNSTTMMLAERCASWLRRDAHAGPGSLVSPRPGAPADALGPEIASWLTSAAGGAVTHAEPATARRQAWLVDVADADGGVTPLFRRGRRRRRPGQRAGGAVAGVPGRRGPAAHGLPGARVAGGRPGRRATLYVREPGRWQLHEEPTPPRQGRCDQYVDLLAELHRLDPRRSGSTTC